MDARGWRIAVVCLLATFAAIGIVATGVVGTGVGAASPRPALDPGSRLIGCDQADARVTVTVTSHLDPACTYHGGFDIVSSDVVFDCQEAKIIDDGHVRLGIAITAPATVALSDITVRHCHVEGYLNSLRVTRTGFKQLTVGQEYDDAPSDIVIEHSTFRRSRGVGIFVDGFVTGVTLDHLEVLGAGSTGVYLEGGSKDNLVQNSSIHDNGFGENGSSGQLIDLAGLTVRWWGTGREGLAIDGSRTNRVVGNQFYGNSAGGIFLYKNCGEYVNERPDGWWPRRYGADGNTIEANTFAGGLNGVWIGSRMGENTLPMDCSDPAYRSNALERIVLDFAQRNVVKGNTFADVTYGIRVEDDQSTVEANRFTGTDPAQQAVIIGTRVRTFDLDHPVIGSTVVGNQADLGGNPSPYRWIHGHEGSTFADNTASGAPAALCEGRQPPVSPFIFVLAFAAEDPDGPPAPMPPLLDQRLPALDACPTSDPGGPTNTAGPTASQPATWASGASGLSGSSSPAGSFLVPAVPRFAG